MKYIFYKIKIISQSNLEGKNQMMRALLRGELIPIALFVSQELYDSDDPGRLSGWTPSLGCISTRGIPPLRKVPY